MKKIACLLISFVMMFGCFGGLVGCGGTDRDYDWKIVDITDDSIPADYDVSFGNGKTLSYSGPDNWYAPASLSKGLPVWKEFEKRTNLKMKWEVLPSSQWEISMMTRINSGRELPDVMGLPNWMWADIDRFSRENIIIPLNELINLYAPNIKRMLNENKDYLRAITAPDGGIYSIDDFYAASEYWQSILIRKDWLDELNLDIPVTVEDFENVFIKFKEKGKIPLFAAGGYQYDYFASGFGMPAPVQDTIIDENGNAIYQRATPEYGEFLKWLNKCYENGWIDARYEAGNTTVLEAEIARNLVGVCVGAGDLADKYTKLLHRSGYPEGEYIMINPPVDSNGNIKIVRTSINGGQIGISADCDDPITAIRFIDYCWAHEEGSRLLRYGLEGQTYNMVDGKVQLTDFVLNNPDGLDPGSALRSIGAWAPMFMRQDYEFLQTFFPQQAIDYYEKNIADGIYIDPFPKAVSTKEEIDRVQMLSTEIGTYQEETALKYVLGRLDISTYQSEYVATLLKLGIREYEEHRKLQYKRIMGEL